MSLYVELPKYIKEMSIAELRQYFPEGTITKIRSSGKNKGLSHEVPRFTQAFLFRSMIMNELKRAKLTRSNGNASKRNVP